MTRRAAKFWVLIFDISLLSGCLSLSADQFAQSIFVDLAYTKVLAFKSRIKTPHGCSYLVLELPEDTEVAPPVPVFPDYVGPSERVWASTLDAQNVEINSRHPCLILEPEKFDWAGVAGFSSQITTILKQQGAWFVRSGGVEGIELVVYAPQDRLAVYLRFGD